MLSLDHCVATGTADTLLSSESEPEPGKLSNVLDSISTRMCSSCYEPTEEPDVAHVDFHILNCCKDPEMNVPFLFRSAIRLCLFMCS